MLRASLKPRLYRDIEIESGATSTGCSGRQSRTTVYLDVDGQGSVLCLV
jgi:hypothetical protein